MSNNIYDILGKLTGLAPKANPVSTAEPIYESIDPRGDIMEAVSSLEERFSSFKEAKAKRAEPEPESEEAPDDLTRSSDPDVVKIATKARFLKPTAVNDVEAIVSLVAKQDAELTRAKKAEQDARNQIKQTQDMLTKNQANQDALRKVIDNTDQRFRALNSKVASGEITAQDQQAAQAAQQIEKDHDAATQKIEPNKAKAAQVAAPTPAKPQINVAPTQTVEVPVDSEPTQQGTQGTVVDFGKEKAEREKTGKSKSGTGKSKKSEPFNPQAVQQVTKTAKLQEYKEGTPDLGIIHYNDVLKALQSAQEKITLEFGAGKSLTLYDYQMYGLIADLSGDQNQERKVARIEQVMSTHDGVVQALLNPKVKKFIQQFPEFAKKSPAFKARKRDIEQNKFTLDPTTAKDPGEMRPQQHPYQQGDTQLEENSGNNKMTKPNSILEAVRSVEDKKLKEAAKPDFLDLDKDGDTDEPMKKAAKDAKDDEPAKPDSDAVAKRKRLQALKDKQEDERAEKGDDYKSASRFVKGRAYGGSAQKDDEDKDELDEGTNFGDTIKNSEGKMTKVKVTEGKDAIRNHPIYTTKEAWDHYAQELAEQESMDQAVMTPETVDVQQELDEIAKLAGLPARMESSCSSCGCADCKCESLNEAATRKDFRMVADLIKNIPDKEKRKELAHHHSGIFKQQNPRFKHDVFCKACGVDECDMAPAAPATIVVGETDAMDEGNEYTKARLDAIQAGKDSFTVGGQTHSVTGDTSDEKQQVEESKLVTEDVNVNVSASGEEDVVNLIRKLSGMSVVAIPVPQQVESEAQCGICGATPCGCEQAVDEEREVEHANTPHEQTAPISAAIPSGTDLNRSKLQDPATANKAANPLGEEKVEESLWAAYEEIINDVKA